MAVSTLWDAPYTTPDTTIISVEDDGVWLPGGTYDIKFRRYSVWKVYRTETDGFINQNDWEYNLVPWEDFAGSTSYDWLPIQPNEGCLFKSSSYASKYKTNSVPFDEPDENSDDNIYLADPTDLLEGTAWSKISQTTIYNTSQGDFPAGYSWSVDSSLEYVYRVTIPADIESGNYSLLYIGHKRLEEFSPDPDRITENEIFYREYYPITIGVPGSSSPAPFPAERLDDYDPDQIFDESENDWTAIDSGDVLASGLGGGRYGQQIVVVSDQAKIYFGGLS